MFLPEGIGCLVAHKRVMTMPDFYSIITLHMASDQSGGDYSRCESQDRIKINKIEWIHEGLRYADRCSVGRRATVV